MAATLFADVLKKGQSLEENANEKQDKETEQKQGESAVVKQSEETKKEVKAEEEEKPREETKAEPSLILKQYLDLKKKHPDAVLLFRCGDFYETYMQDAEQQKSQSEQREQETQQSHMKR